MSGALGSHHVAASMAFFLGPILVVGCSPPKPPIAETPPPTVSVSRPISDKKVQDSETFLATLDAAEKIEVRCRVTGYLKEIKFKAGQNVVKGDVLFIVDRRPFEATAKQSKGQVDIAKAQVKLAQKSRARIQQLMRAKPPSATQEDLDQAQAQVEVAAAQQDAAEGQLEQATINLGFTEIKADVDGLVGRALITEGNLVTADQTLLTTVTKPYPIYAYFDVDQRSVERYRKENEGKKSESTPIALGLDADGEQFPYAGNVNFAAADLNPITGSLLVRAIFDKSDLKEKQIPLQSGYTGRVKVAVGEQFMPILVPDRAIGTDQNQKYVFIVNAENKVEYRKVTLGKAYSGLRVVMDGLKGQEFVIVNGLQRVRQGATVEAVEVDPITELPLSGAGTKSPKSR
jgi:membrane fusion protein, multidrug efflux system